ncbi:RNA-binding protein 1-like isoform X2 [Lineus longissimus]|uniref:RNA-binding protein 1-like isoform X2 n=1 Tax=Lineus longissimus TaxID=88925 RepID=UPI002B4CA748
MPSPPPKTNIKWNMDRRIYIGNMGDGANKEEILDVCSKFGAVKHVWVARKPAGFAFVEFFDKRAAEEAADELDEKWINGHRVCVEMSTGEPKFAADGRPRVGNGMRRSPTLSSAQIAPRQRHNQDSRRPQTSRFDVYLDEVTRLHYGFSPVLFRSVYDSFCL